MNVVALAAALYTSSWYWKQDYHTSALTGQQWVNELIHGHPDRIYSELGMRVHVFLALVANLRMYGMNDSKGILLEEQAAIFLYACVTGLSVRHIGERFQRSNETISKSKLLFVIKSCSNLIYRYFRRVLDALSSPAFYNANVKLPDADSVVHNFIRSNPKLYPFFSGAIGAIDGTHFQSSCSAEERHAARDRKGGLTQNCLAACSWDLCFLYIMAGWEGSVADATMFSNARYTDLRIPHGKYYIADAGFALGDALLTPYRGVRYHLAEWARAGSQRFDILLFKL